MKNPERLNFINGSRETTTYIKPPEASKSDKLRTIQMSKVNDFNEFDTLFAEAVKHQQERKMQQERTKGTSIVDSKPPSNDAFADLDKELGF